MGEAVIPDPAAGRAISSLSAGLAARIELTEALLRSPEQPSGLPSPGVQAAVVRASLAIAAAVDCDLAVVQAEPGTAAQRNLQRLGFRVLYTKPTLVRSGR